MLDKNLRKKIRTRHRFFYYNTLYRTCTKTNVQYKKARLKVYAIRFQPEVKAIEENLVISNRTCKILLQILVLWNFYQQFFQKIKILAAKSIYWFQSWGSIYLMICNMFDHSSLFLVENYRSEYVEYNFKCILEFILYRKCAI